MECNAAQHCKLIIFHITARSASPLPLRTHKTGAVGGGRGDEWQREKRDLRKAQRRLAFIFVKKTAHIKNPGHPFVYLTQLAAFVIIISQVLSNRLSQCFRSPFFEYTSSPFITHKIIDNRDMIL